MRIDQLWLRNFRPDGAFRLSFPLKQPPSHVFLFKLGTNPPDDPFTRAHAQPGPLPLCPIRLPDAAREQGRVRSLRKPGRWCNRSRSCDNLPDCCPLSRLCEAKQGIGETNGAAGHG